MRICIVLSSGGSVVRECLKFPLVRKHVHGIVTDRECEAKNIASEYEIPLTEYRDTTNIAFSDNLLSYCLSENIDIIFSFHLKLYKGKLLSVYKNRVVNFHISLLPAFPGFHSFEKAIIYGVRILGTTIHFIDETTDNGLPIMQTVISNNPAIDQSTLRHRIYVQQCKSFLQIVSWFVENRITVEHNKCFVKGSSFEDLEFVPALDNAVALSFTKSYQPDLKA